MTRLTPAKKKALEGRKQQEIERAVEELRKLYGSQPGTKTLTREERNALALKEYPPPE